MKNYYNEYDRNSAAWIRGLIAEGLIPAGDVDERSITDVQPGDLAGYTQCHFFAGISGWSLALQLAGWPADKQVWTGSCPCQPYSQAGKRKGAADSRDLWPEFLRLISACRPGIVFGEQVASADVIGKAGDRPGAESPPVWLDRVFADLEAARYTCGAADIPAAGVNAPHIRQRLFWVGYAERMRCDTGLSGDSRSKEGEGSASGAITDRPSAAGGMADAGEHAGQPGLSRTDLRMLRGCNDANPFRLGDSDNPGPQGRGIGPHGELDAEGREVPGGPAGLSGVSGGAAIADGGECRGLTDGKGCHCDGESTGRNEGNSQPEPRGVIGGVEHTTGYGRIERGPGADRGSIAGGCSPDHWSDFTIIPCGDGKARRIGTGIQPLVDGLSYRVGARGSIRAPLLKGAGNAIVPQVAAEFIAACREAISSMIL